MRHGWCGSGRIGWKDTVLHPDRGISNALGLAPGLTIACLVIPVIAGAIWTVLPAFEGGLASFANVLNWPGFARSLWLSVKTGLVSTFLAVALTLALIASIHGTAAFRWVQTGLAPLLSVPHAAAALGLAFLIAPSGWIMRLVSPWLTGLTTPPDLLILNDPGGWSLIFGLVAKEIPFLLLMAIAALPQTESRRRLMQAQTFGASKTAAFVICVWPSLYRQLRIPVFAVLVYAVTAVEMAMILGPSLPPSLPVQIVLWMTDATLAHRTTAAAAVVIQTGAVVGVCGLWVGLERLFSRLLRRLAIQGWRGPVVDRLAKGLGLPVTCLLGLALAMGLLGLLVWSVAGLWQFPDAFPASISLKTWAQAGDSLFHAATQTALIAFLACGIALVLVVACLETEQRTGRAPGSWAILALYLPLLVPQIAFVPGLQHLALLTSVQGNWVAVALAHLVFVLPYVFLSLSDPYRAWDPRIAQTAASLGATPARVFWRLRLPMLLRPVLTAFAVGFAVSIGQYLPTLLIGGGRVSTVTTEAVALSSGGNRRLIGAYASLQMLLPMLAFALAIVVPAIAFRHRRGMGAVK